MNTKHTPGPWKIDAGETDEYVIREPRGEVVAVVCDSVLGEDSPNAHLIAAAPELLDALKEAASLMTGLIASGTITYGIQHWVDTIAKAEGRE